ncbi:MAG: hypothetical protein MK082_10805 [Phycisphaerales bacterium]|nr:hypothetical protein [Phycisphaerales bacterium]
MGPMRGYRLREDLDRHDAQGFQLPLGVEAVGLPCPTQGYTLEYNAAEVEDADSYSFHVVASHEHVRTILHAALTLLPSEVFPVVEVGSRDAYRSIDVFSAGVPTAKRDFMKVWSEFEPFLLEDAQIGAGASSIEPEIEIFLDAWKGVSIHVPVRMREEVETMLVGLGLQEVVETWPSNIENEVVNNSRVRDVLVLEDDQSPDLDELLLQMREAWSLELDVERDVNVDEGGRQLGFTLWQAIIVVEPHDEQAERGAYVTIWSTATSIQQVEELVSDALAGMPEWSFQSIYSIDRVAFDERPDELGDLPPRRAAPAVHTITIDIWGEGGEPGPREPFPDDSGNDDSGNDGQDDDAA